MQIGESVRMAQGTLRAHKLRSLLTALGVIIGVSSVIGLLAIVSGIRDSVTRQFSSLGADMISINRFAWGMRRRRRRGSLQTQTDDHASNTTPCGRCRRWISRPRPSTPRANSPSAARTWTASRSAAPTTSIPAIENWTVAEGRFLTADDVRARTRSRSSVPTSPQPVPGRRALWTRRSASAGMPTGSSASWRKRAASSDSRRTTSSTCRTPTFAKQWGIAPAARRQHLGARRAEGRTMQDAIDEIRVALRRVRKVPEGSNGRLRHQHVGRADHAVQSDHPGFLPGHDPDRRHVAPGGRHRHHEHHAGVGDRAHPRDRHPQGDRSAAARHRAAVPHRSRHPVPGWAVPSASRWAAGMGAAVAQFSPLPARVSPVERRARLRGLDLGRRRVRHVAGGARLAKLDPVVALRYEVGPMWSHLLPGARRRSAFEQAALVAHRARDLHRRVHVIVMIGLIEGSTPASSIINEELGTDTFWIGKVFEAATGATRRAPQRLQRERKDIDRATSRRCAPATWCGGSALLGAVQVRCTVAGREDPRRDHRHDASLHGRHQSWNVARRSRLDRRWNRSAAARWWSSVGPSPRSSSRMATTWGKDVRIEATPVPGHRHR